jgi:hypothetical protein
MPPVPIENNDRMSLRIPAEGKTCWFELPESK